MDQPVLPFLPAEARSIGPSAGLLEGPEGGVVFVFGLATFTYAAGDGIGRRLAAVQLVATKAASATEVASAFRISTVTLWRWKQDFTTDGVAGLVPTRTGPRGPSKLTDQVSARIVELNAAGASLRKIAMQTGVSTATVRVALGRVTARGAQSEEPVEPTAGAAGQREADTVLDSEQDTAEDVGESDGGNDVWGDAEPDDRPEDRVVDEGGELVVLAAPVARTAERAAARAGDLDEAPVVITEGAHLPLVGLLLGLPALEATGLLAVAQETFPPMRKGFYGLRVTLLTGVFMALLREPRAEGATRIRPVDLGRLLGLDRAPEVKTLRRKLAELAGHGRGAHLQGALGRHHCQARPDAVGFLYLDGHVRVYTGTRQLPKTHIARMRIAGPATEETWVGDSDGDPVMVITAAPSKSLAAELARLLPDLRALIGPERRCTLVFDRGGYSPEVFATIIAAGFDVLTYFKGTWVKSPTPAFTMVEHTGPDGTSQTYELAQRAITLDVPAQAATPGGEAQEARPASELTLRLIVRRSPDGHQTPILTNRTDLSAAEVAYRMAARWRQENYFKYAREHFALDALDSYADQQDDLDRLVPNPAKARVRVQVAAARANLATAHAEVADAIDAAVVAAGRAKNHGKAEVDPAPGISLSAATTELTAAKATSAATATHLPLREVRPGSRLLETERKLLTHAIRMSAHNTESALARLLRPHYSRGDDEARALLREAFTLPGDLEIIGRTLHVRIDPASAPRRSKALAALCAELTDTRTHYPGTDLTLAYSVKGHPVAT